MRARAVYRTLSRKLVVFIWCASASPVGFAYEVGTHEDISEQAVLQSKLKEFLPSIGLKTINDSLTDIDTTRTVAEWIIVGANHEDDTLSTNLARYRNHFYDPLTGLGLNAAATGEPSPDWGLEDTRTFATQSYSLKDARQYFYDALTLSNKNNREQFMARTFYTLGHVIHLIQDAAQPQHVRNDSHGGGIFGPPSLYEKWTDQDTVRPNLPYTGYPSVTFDAARAFWTGNGKGTADFTNANFLSAGTNFRGTTDPQPNANYLAPRWNGSTELIHFWDLLKEEGINCTPPPPCQIECGDEPPLPPDLPPVCQLDGKVTFYATAVEDKYSGGSATNPRASTASIFDQDLEQNNLPLTFTLNRFNFKAAYPHLIPKAVGYSAGLIDYFFRGKLDIEDIADTGTELQLNVHNASGPDNPFKEGGFKLYYDAVDGARKELSIIQNAAVTTFAPGSRQLLIAARPKVSEVDVSKDSPLTLVFKGKIGQEEGVAAAVADMPLSGFVVTPNYTPSDGIPGARHIYFEDGQWRLGQATGLQAGNIDWKGWYLGGRATRVLSWHGRSTRYGAGGYDTSISRHGKVFAVAPSPVLGAALMKDSAGATWLVVVCNGSGADIVYRRPAKKSTSADLYDPVTAPDGWRQIGVSTSAFSPTMPWFFNGSGTEAQTMRITFFDVLSGIQLTRLRLRIADNAATFEDLGNENGWKRIFTGETVATPIPDALPGDLRVIAWETRDSRTGSGSYVLAVDYRDNEEILCHASLDETGDSRHGAGWTKFPQSGSNAYLLSSEYDVSQVTGRSSLTCGSMDLSLSRDLVSQDFNAIFLDNSFTSSGTHASATTYQNTGIVDYLDIRNGMNVSDSQENTSQFAGSVETTPFPATRLISVGSGNNKKAWSELVRVGGATYTLFENVMQTPIQESGSYAIDFNQNIPYRPRMETTLTKYPGIPLGKDGNTFTRTRGSWVMDSAGNFIVSQTRGANYPGRENTQEYFNFFSGGALEALLPGAGLNPSYFPAALIQ